MTNRSNDLITDSALDQVSGGMSCDTASKVASALRGLAANLAAVADKLGSNGTNVYGSATAIVSYGTGLVTGACGA